MFENRYNTIVTFAVNYVRYFVSLAWLINALLPVDSFSQNFDFGEPQAVVSTKGIEESMPVLSGDGSTLFFTRSMYAENTGGRFAGLDIWSVYRDSSGSWSKPTCMNNSFNDKGNNAVIGSSANGAKLYLMNTKIPNQVKGVYEIRKTKDGWEDPELIHIPGIDNTSFLGFHMNSRGDVLFISMKGPDSRGAEDLYISLKSKDGVWSPPKNLGPAINTSGYEISPFLSADNTRLYFSSNGHGSLGEADIYYSDRLYDSWETWSVPKNLGEKINSKGFDAYFSIYGDSLAFFSSNRSGGYANIYELRKPHQEITLAADDTLYFSENEINAITGTEKGRCCIYLFNTTITSLDDVHKAKLEALVLSIKKQRQVKLHLVALKKQPSEALDIYSTRLLNMLDYIKGLGIEGSRITFGIEQKDTGAYLDKEVVEIRLFQ